MGCFNSTPSTQGGSSLDVIEAFQRSETSLLIDNGIKADRIEKSNEVKMLLLGKLFICLEFVQIIFFFIRSFLIC